MVFSSDSFLFTSESVCEGHPDKLCDQISDAILDACLAQDPESRVACETSAKTGYVMVFGEVKTRAIVDYQTIVRRVVKQVGYDSSEKGFDYDTCAVLVSIDSQSQEISEAVDSVEAVKVDDMHVPPSSSNDIVDDYGAGDQGIMFGYATNETKEMMPLTCVLSHNLTKKMSELRKNGQLGWLRPDGKSQITVEYKYVDSYNGALIPVKVKNVVLSAQTDPQIPLQDIRSQLIEKVIKTVVPSEYLDSETIFHVQSSGKFTIGGPKADAGLTGRKIIVDTYGGWGAHGGGAFSGKDYTKVDRSAAYAARWIAVSLVSSGLCDRCLVQLSYAIGLHHPLSVNINHYGTSKKTEKELLRIINNNFDLRPGAIVKALGLKKPIYQATSVYGHFKPGFPWEVPKKLDLS